MTTTKFINTTARVVQIRVGNITYRHLANIPPNQEYIMHLNTHASYQEYSLTYSQNDQEIIFSSDELVDFEEITLYESPDHKLEYRVSRVRSSVSQHEPKGNIKDSAAFHAVITDASLRLKMIETSHVRLVILSKRVKICPAQCQNLVQICLEGIRKLKEAYYEKSEDDMWQLYSSKKLGPLISSLDKLLSTLWSIQDLLQACGSNWPSMGLVISLPLPPSARKTYSKFDLLIKELNWNFETIHYALHLTRCLEFKWSDSKSRYVLETSHAAGITLAEDMELVQSELLASEDRNHLLSELENGSILVPENYVPENSLLHFLRQYLCFKFAAGQLRDKLAVDLLKRLKETSVLSNGHSSIPDCFWINLADLKLRDSLSGDSNSKSVWKGEWCGQAVAIGITKNTTRAAVEREAGVLLKVQHPNIVGFIGCAFTDDAPPPVCSGKDDKCSAGYLVMELMREDLWHVIDRRAKSHFGSPFTVTVAIDILLQIVGAMVHMHNLDIMHRDLKTANCLVNPKSSSSSSLQVLNLHALKLIDFELSKELDPNAAITNHTANSGTRRWMAPEVWGIRFSNGSSSSERPLVPYSRSADVWSFGMTCYEVITGLLPYHECVSNTDLAKALLEGKRPSIPPSVSCPEGLKELMSRCWAQEPSARPNFKDIEKALWTIKYELEVQ